MMDIETTIHFVLVVPDWRPEQASPSQGFAPSLFDTGWAIRAAAQLPTDIFDLTDAGRETLLARRMSGTHPVRWIGQSPRAVRALPWPVFMPFSVLVLPETESFRDYSDWLNSSPVRPIVIANVGGDLKPKELSRDALQERFISACDRLPAEIGKDTIDRLRETLKSWKPIVARQLGYQVGGHNTVTPNLTALTLAGYEEMVYGRFNRQKEGLKAFVGDIVLTTNSVLDERQSVGERDLQRIFRQPPDLNLFAPAIYPDFFKIRPPSFLSRDEQKQFRAAQQILQRQDGYSFEISSVEQQKALIGSGFINSRGKEKPQTHPLIGNRASELWLSTEIVTALAASEFSAVVRLPNEINRTIGTVRNFAEHYRSEKGSSRKRVLAFRQVQDRLATAVPTEFLDLIRRSETGIRIISDAHVEWLNVDGLPLSIRKNCSRIPVTPGNMFAELTSAPPPLILSKDSFRKVLVISALKLDDPVRRLFEMAFGVMRPRWGDQMTVEIAEVGTEEELVKAINDYDGPLMIFDGHGTHRADEPGKIFLGDNGVDVWSLKGKIHRIPPIIILSACDTHAADRNHGTTANGFMSLGARTVLASVFPLDARDAAIFTGRFLLRVAQLLGAAIKAYDRAITWLEVVSGMLRMQLLTDFLRQLLKAGIMDNAHYHDVHLLGNMAINGLAPDPFEEVFSKLESLGVTRKEMAAQMEIAIANSSVISYLQIGRPETIVIDDRERVEAQLHELAQELQ